jgi:hypothetical protein
MCRDEKRGDPVDELCASASRELREPATLVGQLVGGIAV